MFGRGKWRGVADESPRCTPAQALEYLNADLRSTLASLHEAPKAVAEATIQLLPFGSRSALESLNPPLAIPAGESIDGHPDHRVLKLTAFGYEVMAAAATADHADPQAISAWSERANRAARTATEQAAQRQR